MKTKFRPAYQISALLLEKQKSWKNTALCTAYCALCTPAHIFNDKTLYKNVYEINIQACTTNFSSLA